MPLAFVLLSGKGPPMPSSAPQLSSSTPSWAYTGAHSQLRGCRGFLTAQGLASLCVPAEAAPRHTTDPPRQLAPHLPAPGVERCAGNPSRRDLWLPLSSSCACPAASCRTVCLQPLPSCARFSCEEFWLLPSMALRPVPFCTLVAPSMTNSDRLSSAGGSGGEWGPGSLSEQGAQEGH